MQEIKCKDYLELLRFLDYHQNYTIEPFIKNAKETTIDIENTKLQVLELNDKYYNLYCRIYKGKDLNGFKEVLCHQIAGSFIQKYTNEKFIDIKRYILNEQTFLNQLEKYKIIVLKNKDQDYYENNIIWDWIKVISD